MNNDKVNEVLDRIIAQLEEHEHLEPTDLGFNTVRLTPTRWLARDGFPRSTKEALEHVLWLATESRTWGAERIEKKFRWLGFIQGVLWMTGEQTLEELKNANKPEDAYQPKYVVVSTDRRTVWVNTEKGCVARFCPVSGEIQSADGRFHPFEAQTPEHWEEWRRQVKLHHNISVDVAMPEYLKERK